MNPRAEVPWKSVSFACGGWLQFYLYGVARAIQIRRLDDQHIVYLGCSAGALAAAGIVLNGDFDAAMEFCKQECVPRAHGELFGLFQLHEYVTGCVDRYLLPIYRPIPPGKLQIAITHLPFLKNERKMSFFSKEDFKTTILGEFYTEPSTTSILI
jgi:hypothetical protein